MGNTQSQRVLDIIRHPRTSDGRLFPADLKELQLPPGVRIQDGSREFATVLCCICADGTYLDAAIIMKGKHLQDSWFRNLEDVPSNILFGVSPNGWTDNTKSLLWLKRNFGPGSATEIKAAGEWRILLFDGHVSHVNGEFLAACLDYRVLPVCLPPHTTHFSQPLDVCVFSPLKKAYSEVLHRRTQAGERGVWKGNFYKLFAEAEKIAFTPENIRSGFWCTGLVPLDFDVIRHKLNIPSAPEAKSPATSTTSTSSTPPSPPPPHRLDSLTAAEAFTIATPRNVKDLHHLSRTLREEFEQSNSPRSMKLRHVLDKVENAGIFGLHQSDYLQERLARHDNAPNVPLKRQPRRRLIPEEGAVLANVKDIGKLLHKGREEKRGVRSEKLDKLREKAEKLGVRVAELGGRKEKYKAMENEGKKLPATWKSFARLEEEEKKEATRLQKLLTDICVLEEELADVSDNDDSIEIEE
jgi:hypothetical protein